MVWYGTLWYGIVWYGTVWNNDAVSYGGMVIWYLRVPQVTLRRGRVDPPKIRIVKRTMISVEVTRTDLCSAPNWSCVLKENATAPRRPRVTIRYHSEDWEMPVYIVRYKMG